MSPNTEQTIADMSDRHRSMLVAALLGVAAIYAGRLSERLLPAAYTNYLEAVQILGLVLTMAFLLPIVVWKVRNLSGSGSNRDEYFDDHGFVADALSRSFSASWQATFAVMLVIANFDRTLAGMPAMFFVEFPLITMLVVFSFKFLFLTRASS